MNRSFVSFPSAAIDGRRRDLLAGVLDIGTAQPGVGRGVVDRRHRFDRGR